TPHTPRSRRWRRSWDTRATRPWSPPRSSPPCTATPDRSASSTAPGGPDTHRRCPMAETTTMPELMTVDAGGATIRVRKDLRVPMRDGVQLAADAYEGTEDKPRPALVAL